MKILLFTSRSQRLDRWTKPGLWSRAIKPDGAVLSPKYHLDPHGDGLFPVSYADKPIRHFTLLL